MNTSELCKLAYEELYGEIPPTFSFVISYSGRFTPYNAQVLFRQTAFATQIEFKLSRAWEQTDSQIVVGLLQSLLFKLLRKRRKLLVVRTTSMELYEIFIKKIGNYVPITKEDPVLVASFNRSNSKYFENVIERPNLEWGGKTFRKLGHYNYHTDTIMIAKTLESRMDLVDYVMYHEMLHKKHKFYFKNGRSFHHHHAFKTEEAQYENAAALEIELSKFVRSEKYKFRRLLRVTENSDGQQKKQRSILSWFLE